MLVRKSWAVAALLFVVVPVLAQTKEPAKPAAEPPKPAATPPAATPTAAAAQPAIGKPAPDFSLKGIDGKDWSLASAKGKVVVLEWMNDACPFCQKHMKGKTAANTMGKFKDKPVVWVGVNSTKECDKNVDAMKKACTDTGFTFPVLLDPTGKVGKMFGAKTTPHVFVIDQKGNLAYMGAIDDDEKGDKATKKSYVEEAVNALLTGSTVATPTTTPYGCSVKYAS